MNLTLIQGGNQPDRDDDEYDGVFRDEKDEHPCWDCARCEGQAHHWMTEYGGYADAEPNHPGAKAGLVFWVNCKHCRAYRAERDDDYDDLNGVS